MREKNIKITKCSECPFFTEFPAEYFDGSCVNRESENNTKDTRIRSKETIPGWCPLP